VGVGGGGQISQADRDTLKTKPRTPRYVSLGDVCVAVCCSVLQFDAACCSVYFRLTKQPTPRHVSLCFPRIHCNTMQHTATHCITCFSLATHCNTLQHTATHRNTLQRTHFCSPEIHRNTLQHLCLSFLPFNTLQHTPAYSSLSWNRGHHHDPRYRAISFWYGSIVHASHISDAKSLKLMCAKAYTCRKRALHERVQKSHIFATKQL